MRPLIDANNLNYSKETLIYYTRTNILLRILLLIGLAVAAIYYLNQNLSTVSLLLSGIFLFQIPYLVKEIKRIDEIQFRINSKGIQYRNLILVPWSNIENERVVTEYVNSENSNDYFIYYIIDSGQVMKFDLSKLSTDISELSITLRIHRNRYKRENNIV
ncbi:MULTISPECIES: hypothetical protein [unclassified Flavobacterium]|jgi:hypothetical protein|uniref:hypothetical protein n=1 Tax=unclassified Flavobacterium TaxID=196869 RepID=UPI00188AEF31|nr:MULTISPECIES: hypothetical protein [unclassified Flavobacterium]MBF4485525.1 hypothetical protein [Flavobacterium sp. CSZ]